MFGASVGASLERREAENNLALGILHSLAGGRPTGTLPAEPLTAVVEDGGQLVLALVMTPPMQLIMAGVASGTVSREAVQTAVEGLAALGASVPGVVGEPEIAAAFAQDWEAKNGCSSETVMNQRIYRLDKVNEIPRGPGDLRNAEEADTELVARWIHDFSIDSREPVSYDTAVRKANDSIGESSLYLWENDGKPVSMAKSARPTRHGVVISLVYTPPSLRGKACCASTSRRAIVRRRRPGEGSFPSVASRASCEY